MNFHELIPLIGAIFNALLAVFVLSRGVRSAAHRAYFVVGATIAIWNFGSFRLFVVEDHHSALFWARFLQFGIIFGSVALLHLSLLIAQVQVRRTFWILYGLAALLAASNLTDLFIRDVRILGTSGWYAVAGPLFFFNFPFVLLFTSIAVLIRKRSRMALFHKRRLNVLIFAQSMLIGLGANDTLPIIGVDFYPGTKIWIYPWGSLAAIFYGIMVAYSVLQHQLLDIHVALSRFAAHLMRMTFLLFIGLGLLLIATVIAPDQFNQVSFFSSLVVLLCSAAIASVAFPRIFGVGTESLERRILGDRFEYHDRIREFISSLQRYDQKELLLGDLHELLTKSVRIRSYQIILLDETRRLFSLFRSFPEQPTRDLPELHTQSPVFRFFEQNPSKYLALSLGYMAPGSPEAEQQACEALKDFQAAFCFPFVAEEALFGLFLMGEKASGAPYTATDVTLLASLVKHVSLVINQIRLKNQIQQAQELELLGRMSKGMAHDLNNLLTPISTLVQLSSEGVAQKDLEELLPVALRNIKTMRAYIRESLFFSEYLRPDLQLTRFDLLVQQAADLVEGRLRAKSISLVARTPGRVEAELDEVLIQRLIANLLSNAIDASPAGSAIEIELSHLAKTESHRDWLRLRVIDSGEGIPEEQLSRIFTPYFTTKDRGDEARGFGLGLAICRKIIHLHRGSLTVRSQIGIGTTVQVDLPTLQQKPPAEIVTQ